MPLRQPHQLILRYWPILAVLIGMYGFTSGWLAIFLYHAGIALGMMMTRTSWKTIGRGFNRPAAYGLWLLGVGAAPLVVVLLPLLLQMPVEELRLTLASGLDKQGMGSPWSFWLFVVYLCLPHPGIEELGWRELLFVDSKRPHLRDFEFASYHLLVMNYFFPSKWLFLLGTLLSLSAMAWLWRLLKMRFGGIAVPTWFHAGGDLGVMLGVWWLLR